MQKIKCFSSRVFRAAAVFLRGRAGQIAYCIFAAVLLTAVAVASENYRRREIQPVAPPVQPAQAQAAPVESTEYILPDAGLLLAGYTETPVWNQKLGLWAAHPAQDYKCSRVASICDGTVQAAGSCGAYGNYIEIIGDECLVRYASVEAKEGLEPGDSVKAGETIGTADISMPAEAHLGPHVHLEILKNGRHIPADEPGV